MEIEIREMQANDVPHILAVTGGAAWHRDQQKWEQRLYEHQNAARVVLLTAAEIGIVAYGSLLWSSAYPYFLDAGIPEISDVVVAEAHRGRGIGTLLIQTLEERARKEGRAQVGIGVGLYADYGAAQRLYVRLGYLPDGHGITYRNAIVLGGAQVRADDDLILWLVKSTRLNIV